MRDMWEFLILLNSFGVVRYGAVDKVGNLHGGHLEHEEGTRVVVLYVWIIVLLHGHHVHYSLQTVSDKNL